MGSEGVGAFDDIPVGDVSGRSPASAQSPGEVLLVDELPESLDELLVSLLVEVPLVDVPVSLFAESVELLDVPLVDVADVLPRLSVLKKPDPLNVTPTGVNTFFTGSTSPDSGWAYSVRVSSWNACWTSMVSPLSTNLYT